MTAILGFNVDAQPLIVGDLLVSGNERDVPVFLPTVGNIGRVFPQGTGFTPVGLAQKIAIINDDLAIAWSGTFVHARAILRELRERFGNRPADEMELAAFFEQIPAADRADTTFIAMVALTPTRMCHVGIGSIEIRDPRFGVIRTDGSGAEQITGLLQGTRSITENDGREMTPFAKAVGIGVTMAGQLQGREIFSGDNLWFYYGGGYEIATRVADRWVKLDLLTIFWIARETPRGAVEVADVPTQIIRQAYAGDLLVIRSLIRDPDGPISDQTYIVDPPYRRATATEREAIITPDFQSNWICHQFVVLGLDGQLSPRSRVTFNEDLVQAPVHIQWDGRELRVRTEAGYFDQLREFTRPH